MILKIKELKQKAQVKVYSHGAFGEDETYYRLDEDKFAELIIQECINIFEPPKVDDIKWSYDKAMICMDVQDKIRQYFELEDD